MAKCGYDFKRTADTFENRERARIEGERAVATPSYLREPRFSNPIDPIYRRSFKA